MGGVENQPKRVTLSKSLPRGVNEVCCDSREIDTWTLTMSEAQRELQHHKHHLPDSSTEEGVSIERLKTTNIIALPMGLPLEYTKPIAHGEEMMKVEVDEILTRGLITQQTADDEVHQIRSEVHAEQDSQLSKPAQHLR